MRPNTTVVKMFLKIQTFADRQHQQELKRKYDRLGFILITKYT